MAAHRYCSSCGAAGGGRFCTSCGAALAVDAPAQTLTPAQRQPSVPAAVPHTAAPSPFARPPAAAPAPAWAPPAAPPAAPGPNVEQPTAPLPVATVLPVTTVLPTTVPSGGATPPPWATTVPATPPPRSRQSVLAILVLGALLLSGWAILRGVEEHTLSGSVLVVDSDFAGLAPGDGCTGTSGYDDIASGAQVVVEDETGRTLSTGRLSPGEFDGLGCVFSFALEDVTRAEFYALQVAGENRGELQYSYEELSDDDWSVSLSLGDD